MVEVVDVGFVGGAFDRRLRIGLFSPIYKYVVLFLNLRSFSNGTFEGWKAGNQDACCLIERLPIVA